VTDGTGVGPDTPGQSSPPTTTGVSGADRGLDSGGRPWPMFAHGSEAEMARILDFYAVRWEYEPRTFPILWNLEGEVVESFSPDFYLPDIDLFLELTTLRQRLVRKKNRKLRRIRELYPDIRIKLFYARDFRAMMLKYGRLALADSLSGTLGQVVPDRNGAGSAAADVGAAPGAAAQAGVPTPAGAGVATPTEATRDLGSGTDAAAPGENGGPPPTGERDGRRHASRSRRRRAAAAARTAARLDGPTTGPRATGTKPERSSR
jgi:hypothetical protein